MAYKWVNKFDSSGKISSTEIKEKLDDLEGRILDKTPVSPHDPYWKRYNSEAIPKHVATDAVVDEIQENLDLLKQENYCRGHHNAECYSDNALNDTNYHNSRLDSQHTDYNSTLYSTEHTDQNIAEHITEHSSLYVTYNASANTSYKDNHHISE